VEGRPQTLWLDASGRPTDAARAGLRLIGEAAAEGLDPADYDATALSELAARLDEGPSAAALVAEFNAWLSAAVERYYQHVHFGRVDPRALGLQFSPPPDDHDFASLMRAAIAEGRVEQVARELAPPIRQYQALKSALARYRAIAATAPQPPSFAKVVRPGDPLENAARLRAWLAALGDATAEAVSSTSDAYDPSLVEAVQRFQHRHGLEADGVIGKGTATALAVPAAWRVRQIELGLERLRWLPDLSEGRLVAVNIPMFQLWAWDGVPSADPPALAMSVIVGRALNTRTPVFSEHMRYLVFRPYWNVPSSILRNEVLPRIRKDVSYLGRENMEIVLGPSDTSPVVDPTDEHIAMLAAGTARVRQRPGPRNALGLVKFMFPNRNDVYMHDTPAPQLFQRSRRDFSHGCIRVEDPVALAEWVLRSEPAWTRERITVAMNGAPNVRVDLTAPVQVVIFYTTAVVQPEDGAVHFAEDLYRQDPPLDRALVTRSAADRPRPPGAK
jgi:murein L,D-transpeptidase YcbB/YkuD